MAVRSGAGTGVVVSLVVFVLTTVFLLVLTIVFYAGKTKEVEQRAQAETALNNYATSAQRNSDQYKAFEAAAKEKRSSVAGYLVNRYDEAMTFVSGTPGATVDQVKAELARVNLKEGDSLKAKMLEMSRDLQARQAEIDTLNSNYEAAQAQLAEKEAQLKQEQETRATVEAGFETQISGYRESSETYKAQLDEAIAELNRAKDTLRNNYEGQLQDLVDDNDNLNREMQVMRGKLAELERQRNDARIRAQDPSTLVDARIVDVPGSADEVFIDKGRRDRVVLGMTFEVYSDSAQLASFARTNELPRGKASLQVTKVGDATSTAKVTRRLPGQPVVRGDVLANAVYDPTYRFKFLVHGKFDLDNDGRPTETEAEYLRSLIMEWGGTVVTGEQLPGDLDFLILGFEPPKPPPAATDASQAVIASWIERNQAHELYNQLFRQAREAQIPVLNANRFLVLIGHTQR